MRRWRASEGGPGVGKKKNKNVLFIPSSRALLLRHSALSFLNDTSVWLHDSVRESFRNVHGPRVACCRLFVFSSLLRSFSYQHAASSPPSSSSHPSVQRSPGKRGRSGECGHHHRRRILLPHRDQRPRTTADPGYVSSNLRKGGVCAPGCQEDWGGGSR